MTLIGTSRTFLNGRTRVCCTACQHYGNKENSKFFLVCNPMEISLSADLNNNVALKKSNYHVSLLLTCLYWSRDGRLNK